MMIQEDAIKCLTRLVPDQISQTSTILVMPTTAKMLAQSHTHTYLILL